MIEKIRIFVSQLVTSALVVFLAVRVGLNIINNTGLKIRLSNIGFDHIYESFESIAVGLLLSYLAVMCMIFVIGLMRWPKTNYAKKKKKRKTARQIDMGKVKPFPKDYGDFSKTIKAK